jgi:Domain of unknown function (DUF4296)
MRVIALLFTFIILSCGSNDKVPKDVLEPQKMERVMTDILMAESFSESYLLLDTTKKRDEWFTGELNKVLAINQISQDQFRKSMDFYKSRPDIFKVIIDSINAKGQRNRDKIYDMQKKTRVKVE